MLHKLRQISMLVSDLPETAKVYKQVLGMESIFEEKSFIYPLQSQTLPAGNGTFVGLIQPNTATGPISKYLKKRGPCPYLISFETKCFDDLISNLKDQNVEITEEGRTPASRYAFLHPKSTNGAFLKVVESLDPEANWVKETYDVNVDDVSSRTLQLRQVAVLVKDLDEATEHWHQMFGIVPTQRFEISFTDLEIAVLPLGDKNTFIELAQPTSVDSPSARFLNKYGEGIYLTIFEISKSLELDEYLCSQNIRYTTSRQTNNYVNLGFNSIWIHPSAISGAFIQLSQVLDQVNPWPPAGEDWYQ